MDNYLEAIPCDILQHIAFLTTIDSYPWLGAPRDILTLLRTSPTLYHTLSMRSCPHLYADIFRSTFDVHAPQKRFRFQITDSALAEELVLRYKMLRRVRARIFSNSELRQDLWTAFWMVQESDGLNELQLRYAGLSEYILDLVKSWSTGGGLQHFEKAALHEIRSLVIWLLCFTLTRQHILSLPSDARDALQFVLSPYSRNFHRPASSINGSFLLSHLPWRGRTNGTNDIRAEITQATHREHLTQHQWRCGHETKPIVIYAHEWVPTCPDPSPAAINLLFCLREIDPMVVPEHLPESRSIAIATQRFGPTKEDVRRIRGYRTELFADTAHWPQNRDPSLAANVGRSERHDVEFQKMVFTNEGAAEVKALSAMRGTLTGVWEGFYMMAGVVLPTPGAIGGEGQRYAPPDFICRKPLQAVFTEYLCFSDSVPDLDDVSGLRNFPKMGSETEEGFEIDGCRYERSTADPDSRRRCHPGKWIREPVDIVLLGETLEEHAQAWGGFRYTGRIRKDGSIILKREPKDADGDGPSGTWIFNGRVRFGSVFVGTWCSSSSPINNTSSVQGVFSMQQRANSSTSW
ncbi:hypothetical protein P691DRAFT_436622 [Macrolepiota fuliginosa MF-IS2]|uniref:F-box domain-containing protein n=1 Tax=Macrolepiota fuliginosa MF-IS2 TaxID=1400762 RepID=A0A9P6C6X3_9AGAR|nr:hypothetical protein P691DRAFT_436622 [Macrolepiota fuliginosa MF-IS2]